VLRGRKLGGGLIRKKGKKANVCGRGLIDPRGICLLGQKEGRRPLKSQGDQIKSNIKKPKKRKRSFLVEEPVGEHL